MAQVEMDKAVTLSGTGVSADQIPLEGRQIRGLTVQAEYTVTDAGLSAGENFSGYVDTMEIVADGKSIFQVKTDELISAITVLSGGRFRPVTQLYTDADPTTAEPQRARFHFPFPHDLGRYKNVYFKFTSRATTSEFGGASAMSGTVRVILDCGPISDSIVLERIEKSTATQHDILVQECPMVRFIATGAGANTVTKLDVKGGDDVPEVHLTQHQAMAQDYHFWAGAAAADDTDTTIGIDNLLVQPKSNGSPQISLTLSSTAAMKFFLVKVAGQGSPVKGNYVGDIARGKARTSFTSWVNQRIAAAKSR